MIEQETPSTQSTTSGSKLRTATVTGFKWSFISVLVVAVIQVAYSAIMARLVSPEAFGLIAMANIILRFGTYFSRMGIGSAIIQKKDLSDNDVQAAFTSAIGLGLLVSIIIIIAAPLGELIFNNDQVVPIVQVMAITLFITGLSTTSNSLLRREFRFKEIAIAEIVSFILGAGVVGILMAFFGFGAWSLVYSSIAQGIILTLICYAYNRHSLKLTFDFKKYQPILAFGSKISIISFLEFLCYNLDTMVIGRIAGPDILGYYNRANYLVNIPANKITASLTNVLFPAFSRKQESKEGLQGTYLSTITILGTLLFVYAFAVSAAANEIILVLMGENWVPAIQLLSVLSIAVPFSLLKSINGVLLEATAKLNFKIFTMLVYLFTLGSLFIVLYPLLGVVGFAWSYFMCEFIFYFIYQILIIHMLNMSFIDIGKINFPIISGILTYFSVFVLKTALHTLDYLPLLFFEIFLSFTLLILFFYFFPSKTISATVINLLSTTRTNIHYIDQILDRVNSRYKSRHIQDASEVIKP